MPPLDHGTPGANTSHRRVFTGEDTAGEAYFKVQALSGGIPGVIPRFREGVSLPTTRKPSRYTGPRELPVLQDPFDGRRDVGGGRGPPVPHLRVGLVRSRRDPRVDAGALAGRRGGRPRDRFLLSGEGGQGCLPATRLERGPGPFLSAMRGVVASRRLPAHGDSGLPLRRVRRDARLASRREGSCRAIQIPARPRPALRVPRHIDGGRGTGPDEPPARSGRRGGGCWTDPDSGPRSPRGRDVFRD